MNAHLQDLSAGAVIAHELGQVVVVQRCLLQVQRSLGRLLAAVHKDQHLGTATGKKCNKQISITTAGVGILLKVDLYLDVA
jgi:hypothetical protein